MQFSNKIKEQNIAVQKRNYTNIYKAILSRTKEDFLKKRGLIKTVMLEEQQIVTAK